MIGSAFYERYIEEQYFIWMLYQAYNDWPKKIHDRHENLPIYVDTKEGYLRYHIHGNKNWDCADLIKMLNFYDDLFDKLNISHKVRPFSVIFHIPSSRNIDDIITALRLMGVNEGELDN